MPPQAAQDRIKEIERLMKLFYPERMAHMIISIVSALFLAGCAVFLVLRKEYEWAFGLFGATGAITYSSARLLKMWNDVIRVLYGKEVED